MFSFLSGWFPSWYTVPEDWRLENVVNDFKISTHFLSSRLIYETIVFSAERKLISLISKDHAQAVRVHNSALQLFSQVENLADWEMVESFPKIDARARW